MTDGPREARTNSDSRLDTKLDPTEIESEMLTRVQIDSLAAVLTFCTC